MNNFGKSLFGGFCVIISFIPVISNSQITLTENDFPEADDTIRLGTDNVHNFNGNNTGADYTWNFSTLQASNQSVDTFVSVFSTIAAYNVIFNPLVANLATPNNTPPSFPSLTITDSYDFYKLGSSYYRKAGFGAKVNGVPTPVKYDNPELYMSLPAHYGDTDSSESFYGIPVPGIGYFGQTIKRKYTIDGWGTLIIPYGTFSVIRVKYEVQNRDTIYSSALGVGYAIQRPLSTEYCWCGNSMDVPLLKITSGNGPSNQAVFRDSVFYTGINHGLTQDCRIFPNPASEKISIVFASPANRIYRITSQNGKIITSWLSNGIENNASIQELLPGLYFLEIESGKEKSVYSFVKF